MHGTLTTFVAWVLGGMFLGIALSGFGLAGWWGAPERRLGVLAILGRASLAALSIVGVLAGMYLLSLGTERVLGDPLRRWSGAPIVPETWIALELLLRDLAWSAAHARRSDHTWLAVLFAGATVTTWLAAKTFMILSGYVALWAWLGW